MTRETIPAQDVEVGDFTFMHGYRAVTAVKRYPRRREVRLTMGARKSTLHYNVPVEVARDA